MPPIPPSELIVNATSPTTSAALKETRESLASVFRNRGLRRVNLALAGAQVNADLLAFLRG